MRSLLLSPLPHALFCAHARTLLRVAYTPLLLDVQNANFSLSKVLKVATLRGRYHGTR